MRNMFYNCSSLTQLDLYNFNTNNVIDVSNMFYSCTSLISLNIASFNLLGVDSYSMMFDGCYNLTLTIVPEYCFKIMGSIPKYVNVIEII